MCVERGRAGLSGSCVWRGAGPACWVAVCGEVQGRPVGSLCSLAVTLWPASTLSSLVWSNSNGGWLLWPVRG